MTNKRYHIYIDNESYKNILDLKYALGLRSASEAIKIMVDYYVKDKE